MTKRARPQGVRTTDISSGIVGNSVVGKLPTFPHFPRNVRYSAGMSSKSGYPPTLVIGLFSLFLTFVVMGGEEVGKMWRRVPILWITLVLRDRNAVRLCITMTYHVGAFLLQILVTSWSAVTDASGRPQVTPFDFGAFHPRFEHTEQASYTA